MASQMNRRIHVSHPSEYIIEKQTMTPATGIKGTHGVLNGRGRSGWVLRSTMTPMQTITKANSVPMEVMWPSLEIGTKPAKMLTKTMKSRLDRHGVRHVG